MRTTLAVTIAVIVVLGIGVGLYALHSRGGSATSSTTQQIATGTGEVLKICSAGSLSIPLNQLANLFEQKYHVKVDILTAGSVSVVRRVTELHYPCDLVFVADYRLIPKMMVPNFTSWYIAFATNELVIVYTNSSKYHELIEKDPSVIFRILNRSDVTYGFSNPNMDPCGYRSVGAIALASIYYSNPSILKSLVEDKIEGVKVVRDNDTLKIYIPVSFNVKGNLIMRDKSVDLIALVESGSLDYAFEYRSVAVQHHLNYVELPPQINLGDTRYSNFYSKVIVYILAGSKDERAIPMAPIVYGVTIPKVAQHKALAIKFLKMLLSSEGRGVFEENGQRFLPEPLGYGAVPGDLLEYVKVVKG